MKTIPLTNSPYLLIVDNEDYDRCSSLKWSLSRGYGQAYHHGEMILIHRYVLNLFNDPVKVDHKFHNKLDNRKKNLRICNASQNQANRKPNKGTTYKGVYFHQKANKFIARIAINNTRLHLGCFTNEIEAAKAYDLASIKYFGEFAKLNFPKS